MRGNTIQILNYEKSEALNNLEKLKRFLIEFSKEYKPFSIEVMDFDLLHTDEYNQIEKNFIKGKFPIRQGWLNYFSKDYPLPELPNDFDLEILDNGDKILYSTREEYNLQNEEHKKESLRINKYFIDNGIYLHQSWKEREKEFKIQNID